MIFLSSCHNNITSHFATHSCISCQYDHLSRQCLIINDIIFPAIFLHQGSFVTLPILRSSSCFSKLLHSNSILCKYNSEQQPAFFKSVWICKYPHTTFKLDINITTFDFSYGSSSKLVMIDCRFRFHRYRVKVFLFS